LYAGLCFRFDQNVRERDVVDIRFNPTCSQIRLWIAIDHEGLIASKGATSRQLPRECCLTNAAFLVRHCNDFHRPCLSLSSPRTSLAQRRDLSAAMFTLEEFEALSQTGAPSSRFSQP